MSDGDIELGDGFAYRFFRWAPDRDLNPQYEGIPDIDPAGIIVTKDDVPIGSCWFDNEDTRRVRGGQPAWQLVALEPLHIEPSIQTHSFYYGLTFVPDYHGFIRDGKWVNA